MNSQQAQQEKKKERKKIRHSINRFAMLLNHFAAIGLLISYLSPHISPQIFWLLAFFGLAYPILLIINVLFILYWLVQFKKRFIYSLLIIFCGFNYLSRTFQFKLSDSKENDKALIKIMSYNVKAFDLYNWTKNTETKTKMYQLIADENPEIVCFQEFYSRDSSAFDNYDSISTTTKLKNIHVEYTSHARLKQHFGIATYSKFPIVNRGKIDFGYKSNNVCIYTDLIVGKDTIRVYNMHLQSIAFSKDDYKFAEELHSEIETKEEVERSKNILRRLKRAFVKRSKQADIIGAHIASSKYKVIVCGDFNDTPTSYTYNTISDNLKDSFLESGRGLGKTYSGVFPSFRIDYILHDKKFNSYNYKTIKEEYSDHFPIVTYISKD